MLCSVSTDDYEEEDEEDDDDENEMMGVSDAELQALARYNRLYNGDDSEVILTHKHLTPHRMRVLKNVSNTAIGCEQRVSPTHACICGFSL